MTTEPANYREKAKQQRKGVQFPWKLHHLLDECEKNGDANVISWLPDGKAFKVHQKVDFSTRIMPAFFNSSKHKTFQRSLNLWGFEKVNNGPGKGACYHPFFIRGKPDLCHSMMRVKIKGNCETAGKFNEAVSSAAAKKSLSASESTPEGAAAPKPLKDASSTSLLRYLSQKSKGGLLPRPPFPTAGLRSSTASVSDYIRSAGTTTRGSEAPEAPSQEAQIREAHLREAQFLHRLKLRNDALKAALATTTATSVSALVAQTSPFASMSPSLEADLLCQRYATQGLDSFLLPRRRSPVYEAALAAAVASKIVQL